MENLTMRFIATGRVQPERAETRFDTVEGAFGGGGKVVTSCDASQLSVVMDLPGIERVDEARTIAQHFATMFVCALGFSNGCGYSAEIIQVFDEGGVPAVFGVQPTDEAGKHLGFDAETDIFTRVVLLAGHNIFFRLALRDYARALAQSEDCASYCYRAVEAIMQAFGNWESMHAALHTDRQEIEKRIQWYAAPVRHGNWINTKPAEGRVRWEMLSLTRDVLTAYLDYAKPGITGA
jgi:hypothetical protein